MALSFFTDKTASAVQNEGLNAEGADTKYCLSASDKTKYFINYPQIAKFFDKAFDRRGHC